MRYVYIGRLFGCRREVGVGFGDTNMDILTSITWEDDEVQMTEFD